MGFYSDRILPRGIDWVMRGRDFSELRKKYLREVKGDVLEIGFGSGLNLPHYPSSISKLIALDPSRLGRRLASRRISDSPFPVQFVDWDNGTIDLPDHSMDSVVTTWTLCTIPDVGQALNEIKRVLKKEGTYFFVEHGQSPDIRVARFQGWWNPLQNKLAGGCHVNRPMEQLISAGGFKIEQLDNFYMAGPKIFSYMFCGWARVDGRPG